MENNAGLRISSTCSSRIEHVGLQKRSRAHYDRWATKSKGHKKFEGARLQMWRNGSCSRAENCHYAIHKFKLGFTAKGTWKGENLEAKAEQTKATQERDKKNESRKRKEDKE